MRIALARQIILRAWKAMLTSANHGGMTTVLLPYLFHVFSEGQFCVLGNREDGFSPDFQQKQFSLTDTSCTNTVSTQKNICSRPFGFDSMLQYSTAFMFNYLHGTLSSIELYAPTDSEILAWSRLLHCTSTGIMLAPGFNQLPKYISDGLELQMPD